MKRDIEALTCQCGGYESNSSGRWADDSDDACLKCALAWSTARRPCRSQSAMNGVKPSVAQGDILRCGDRDALCLVLSGKSTATHGRCEDTMRTRLSAGSHRYYSASSERRPICSSKSGRDNGWHRTAPNRGRHVASPPSRSALINSPSHNSMQFADFEAFIARPLEAQEERKEHGIASKRLHQTRTRYVSLRNHFPFGAQDSLCV